MSLMLQSLITGILYPIGLYDQKELHMVPVKILERSVVAIFYIPLHGKYQ